MRIFLNTYTPLGVNHRGWRAVETFGLHPLEDGSIRREPDFTHARPGISGLCRPGAMQSIGLAVDDVLVYKTNSKGLTRSPKHVLGAILQVTHIFDTHAEAADWYLQQELGVPSNNITMAALPLDHSHGIGCPAGLPPDAGHERWDREYRERGSRHGNQYFIITNPIYTGTDYPASAEHWIHLRETLTGHHDRRWHATQKVPFELSAACYNEIFSLLPNPN